MKTCQTLFLLLVACAILSAPGLGADSLRDLDPVPYTLSDITDPSLAEAIRNHSPNYDELGRGSQIFTYVDMYRWHNNGISPALNDGDRVLLEGAEDTVAAVHDLSVPVVHDYKDAPDQIRSVGVDWFDSPKLEAETLVLEQIGY